MTETTYWRCEHCETQGAVEYEIHASVYEVVDLLRDSHRANAPSSCEFDVMRVRVSREPFAARAALGAERA